MPLRPIEFQILLTLAAEDRHGYGIMQEAARLTGGELRLEAGTLYRALHRMLKAGWVAASARKAGGDLEDDRRRYYRLTAHGRRVASDEAQRLSRLVSAARAQRLLTRA
jgi:DNA-binding PadR family transcriptional regulator